MQMVFPSLFCRVKAQSFSKPLKFSGGHPKTIPTGHKQTCRPEGVSGDAPVIAASSNAGVEIGMSPDLVSLLQEYSKWLQPSTPTLTR